ncbi:MAG: ribosomal RNA small subunit methyltransferase A [Thermoplasmata archaeon]|nr:MAG: ribosomal RNA small subunit methyltransferase A [Thermoplasmata archaeon]RLF51003.1 MAG: ribosomal RNA small subunit methyltransferase A [Thermoplasmata archaeon]
MKSKLGQNFLIDKKVAEREVQHANVNRDDVVLEIGPGRGILTKLLAEKAGKVLAVEIDEKLIQLLKKFLPKNVELIHGDVLKVDFETLPRFNKVVSNLPFQISSPVTFKLLNYGFDLAVLVYQKEFADRLVAKPGDKNYSRLSVHVYYKADCKVLEVIPKTCFEPEPKVDSCMVKLIPRKNPPFHVWDEDLFLDVTRKLFIHRRKKIRTSLIKLFDIDIEDGILYMDRRVEELSPEEIGELSNVLYRKTKNIDMS